MVIVINHRHWAIEALVIPVVCVVHIEIFVCVSVKFVQILTIISITATLSSKAITIALRTTWVGAACEVLGC